MIGSALAIAVNILNPQLVVIGGELAQAGDVLLDPIRTAVDRTAVMPAARAARITGTELGSRAEVLGAAALQLARAPQVLAGSVLPWLGMFDTGGSAPPRRTLDHV